MTLLEKVLLITSILLLGLAFGEHLFTDQKELCLRSGGTAVESNGSFERCIK